MASGMSKRPNFETVFYKTTPLAPFNAYLPVRMEEEVAQEQPTGHHQQNNQQATINSSSPPDHHCKKLQLEHVHSSD